MFDILLFCSSQRVSILISDLWELASMIMLVDESDVDQSIGVDGLIYAGHLETAS
jgi:hypothetical protein